MTRIVFCAAVLAAWTAGVDVQPAQAAVERTERVSYYDIAGDRLDTIMRELAVRGPTDDSGQRFHARTDAHIDWRFSVRQSPTGCAVTNVTTKLTLVTIMPRLNSADGELQQAFGNYTGRLMVHESGHIENARKTAAEIDAAISSLAPTLDCQSLKARGNALGHRLFDEGERRDVAYDRATDHGRIQGAQFP
jgi:predicted secreted Zn-dependent protease